MNIEMRKAEIQHIPHVSSLLIEAASWLESIDQPLWPLDDLTPEMIAQDVRNGLYYLAWKDAEPVGVLKYQLNDETFWPDVPTGESAFVHRLAVRRNMAGSGLSTAMLDWAKRHTRERGLRYLRLDCVPRPELCALYERNGFKKHSEIHAGPHYVVRYEFDTRVLGS